MDGWILLFIVNAITVMIYSVGAMSSMRLIIVRTFKSEPCKNIFETNHPMDTPELFPNMLNNYRNHLIRVLRILFITKHDFLSFCCNMSTIHAAIISSIISNKKFTLLSTKLHYVRSMRREKNDQVGVS